MLKSHFNLAQTNAEEQLAEEEQKALPEFAGEGGTEEEKVVYPGVVLRTNDVARRLSMLGKTADGDGYTYLKATLTGLSLTNIDAIKFFHHLQFVDLSRNHLDLESLQVVTELPSLVLIHADKNELHSAALKKTKYLQVMILNENNITSVHDVYQPELCTLEVGNNKIQKIKFNNRMPNLKCLDFRNNIIEDISGINFPKLDSLYLAGNKIKDLVGLETLVNLRILHVRHNPIKLLEGFDPGLTKLQYINLRNCKVSSLKQIKKLKVLPALETLVLKGCPIMGGTGEEEAEAAQEEDDPDLRIDVLATLTGLKRLNKGVVSPEERKDAMELMMQWVEDGEKAEDEDVEEEQAGEESNPHA